MTVLRYIAATTLALALMTGVFATPAMAEETKAEQEQKLEQEIECNVSGYGQATCKAKQTGEQRQKVLGVFRKDGTFVPVHKPAATGLDGYTLALVSGTVLTGSAAAYLKVKSK